MRTFKSPINGRQKLSAQIRSAVNPTEQTKEPHPPSSITCRFQKRLRSTPPPVAQTQAIPPRWQFFAKHLLEGLNATDAYLLAGYRTTSRPSAQAAAARLRPPPRFATYYQKLRRQADAKSRRRTIRAIRRKLHTLDRIIHSGPLAISPRDRSIAVHRKTNRYGGRVVHLPCKLTAIRQYLELTGCLDFANPSRSIQGLNF